jgi:CheY-like chemotaxis protein
MVAAFFKPELPIVHRASVLLVEDEPVSRKAMKVLLTWSGYAVTAVSNGEEALDFALHCNHPLIALIDFNLPGIDGLDLIERMEAQHIQFTPVLITASGDESVRVQAQRRSIRFMRKPINVRQLTQFLAETDN